MKTFDKILNNFEWIIGIAIIIFFLFNTIIVRFNGSPGTGEKIGQIVKISKQGIINKTWEGELIRGGMNGGNGSFGIVPFHFTIQNDELAAKSLIFMNNQTEVSVKYRIKGIYSPFCSENHGVFLEGIDSLVKTNK